MIDTKKCTRCGSVQPVDQFLVWKDGGSRRVRSWCKSCEALYSREEYRRSKQRGITNAHIRIDRELWSQFQQLNRRRGVKASASMARLIRAELEREAAREMLGAIRKVAG